MSWQLFQLSKHSFDGVAVEYSVLPLLLLSPYLRRRHVTGSRSRLREVPFMMTIFVHHLMLMSRSTVSTIVP